MADDIVHHFLRVFAVFAPRAEVLRAEQELRQEWGGRNLYVPRGPDGYRIKVDGDSTRQRPK